MLYDEWTLQEDFAPLSSTTKVRPNGKVTLPARLSYFPAGRFFAIQTQRQAFGAAAGFDELA